MRNELFLIGESALQMRDGLFQIRGRPDSKEEWPIPHQGTANPNEELSIHHQEKRTPNEE